MCLREFVASSGHPPPCGEKWTRWTGETSPWAGRRHSKEETLLTVSFLGQQPHACDKGHVLRMELLWGNSRVPFGPKKSQG